MSYSFGPGSAQLLEMIALTGTITAASEAMHMSYSKAWKMLNQIEKQLGDKIVVRVNGGCDGRLHLLDREGQVAAGCLQGHAAGAKGNSGCAAGKILWNHILKQG